MASTLCVAVLVGLPGSGKTTLCKFLKDRVSLNALHLCYDDLISSTYTVEGNEWHFARQEVLMLVDQIVSMVKSISPDQEKFLLNIKSNPDNNFVFSDFQWEVVLNRSTVIFIDDNMYYSSMRYSYFQLARRYKIGFCQIFLKCDLDSALKCNKQRRKEQIVPEYVIKKMENLLEPPGKKSWEQYFLHIPAHGLFENNIASIRDLINKALLDPVETVEDESCYSNDETPQKIKTSNSILHQVDLCLRNVTNERIKMLRAEILDATVLKEKCNFFTAERTKILCAVKARKIVIPENICESIEMCRPLAAAHLREFILDLFP